MPEIAGLCLTKWFYKSMYWLRRKHGDVLAPASVSKGTCLWISLGNASAAGQPHGSCITFELPVVAGSIGIFSENLSPPRRRMSIESRDAGTKHSRKQRDCRSLGNNPLKQITYMQALVGFPKAEEDDILPKLRSTSVFVSEMTFMSS